MILIRARWVASAAVGVLLLAVLTGCGGDDKLPTSGATSGASSTEATSADGTSPTASTPSAGAPSAAATSPAATGESVAIDGFVRQLTAAMKDQTSVHLSITGNPSLQYEADFQYGRNAAARVRTSAGGIPITLVVVDDVLYVQQSNGKYLKAEKDDPRFRGLGEFSTVLDPVGSIGSLRPGISKVVKVGKVPVDGEQLTRYDATVDISKVNGALTGIGGSGTAESATMSIFLDPQGRIRQLSSVGEGQTMAVKYSDWGKPVDIKAPSGAQLAPAPTS